MSIDVNKQVEYVNEMIAKSPVGSSLRNIQAIEDPSASYQVVLATWLEFFLLNRRQHLCESDIVALHEKARNLLRLLNEVMPERTGSTLPDDLLGWNFWKAHAILHQAMERMMYGYSEITSAQGSESAHKVKSRLI